MVLAIHLLESATFKERGMRPVPSRFGIRVENEDSSGARRSTCHVYAPVVRRRVRGRPGVGTVDGPAPAATGATRLQESGRRAVGAHRFHTVGSRPDGCGRNVHVQARRRPRHRSPANNSWPGCSLPETWEPCRAHYACRETVAMKAPEPGFAGVLPRRAEVAYPPVQLVDTVTMHQQLALLAAR